MKPIHAIKNILSGLFHSLKRFPITIFLSASVACILIIISETNPSDLILVKIAMVLALGIPLSTCIKLFLEKQSKGSSIKSISTYALGAAILVLYYFFLLSDLTMVEVTRYIAVSLALYLAFIFVPYLTEKDDFELYVITLLSRLFITILYSIVLYSGLSAILFAIDRLLGIRIDGDVYYYTFLIVVFLFGVTYFLAGVPSINDNLNQKSYPKLLKILLLYIVMPLIIAYTIILYIYFAKIIITGQWPVNIVTNLVLWYSVISALVLFFITPLIASTKWACSFMKFFPKIILPVLVMMFISIFIRINAYGVTEKRYFVVVLALWASTVMLYLSFSRKPKNKLMLISLSILSLISVFGPLSSYSISKTSQNKRFELILIKNNMVKDGRIQPASNISKEDKENISSILDYFNRNHSLEEVKFLPEGFKLIDMLDTFGFEYEEAYINSQSNYFYLSTERAQKLVDLKDYDYFLEPVVLNNGSSYDKKSLHASYNYNSAIIKISNEGKEIYSKDFSVFIQNLAAKYKGESEKNQLPIEEMIFADENENLKVKFIFRNISGNTDVSTKRLFINGMDFYVLIKLK